MLDKFREVWDEIEQKILARLERPQGELAKLKEERRRKRRRATE